MTAPRALRVLAVGAFPFPSSQGSQVFAAAQSRALARAGAAVELLVYGRGLLGAEPEGVAVTRIPRVLSPASLRSGPSPGKPFADLALALVMLRRARATRPDVLLAHNAEAAAAALAIRPACRVPVVYLAHTLLGRELSSYARPGLAPALDVLGRRADAVLAGRSDGVIALSRCAAASLARHASGPVEWLPPGLDPLPPPAPELQREVCARHGVGVGSYALYSGNLDGYQELAELEQIAARVAPTPVVIATHEDPGGRRHGFGGGVRIVRVRDFAEMRALLFGARVLVAPRRRPGGFPIKLLNYMEAGRPIAVREQVAETLRHDASAWVVGSDGGAEEMAAAVARLWGDPALAERLGRGARACLEAEHAWPRLAERTLAHLRRLAGPTAGARTAG